MKRKKINTIKKLYYILLSNKFIIVEKEIRHIIIITAVGRKNTDAHYSVAQGCSKPDYKVHDQSDKFDQCFASIKDHFVSICDICNRETITFVYLCKVLLYITAIQFYYCS